MNLRRSIATVAVIALPLGLSGCGFDAPTDQVYTPAVGVNNQDGQVDVLNALIVSAEDGSGTLVVSLANNDQAEPDALAGVAGQGRRGRGLGRRHDPGGRCWSCSPTTA